MIFDGVCVNERENMQPMRVIASNLVDGIWDSNCTVCSKSEQSRPRKRGSQLNINTGPDRSWDKMVFTFRTNTQLLKYIATI